MTGITDKGIMDIEEFSTKVIKWMEKYEEKFKDLSERIVVLEHQIFGEPEE